MPMWRVSLLVSLACLYVFDAFAQTTRETHREIIFGAYLTPGAPSSVLLTNYADAILTNSERELVPNLMIYGEAGSEEQILAGLRRGRIQIATQSTVVLTGLVPETAILGAPYLFESQDQFNFVFDNYLFDWLKERLARREVYALGWIDLGRYNIYGQKPILTPADIKGYPVRAVLYETSKLFLEAVEADTIPLPSPDVIQSLQTGLIKGGIASTTSYVDTGVMENALNFTLTGHSHVGVMLVAGKRWFDNLSAQHRNILATSLPSNAELRRDLHAIIDKSLKQAVQTKGLKLYNLSQGQRAEWIASTSHTHAKLIETIGGEASELYEQIKSLQDQHRDLRTAERK